MKIENGQFLYNMTGPTVQTPNNFLVTQLYYLTQNQIKTDKLFILWVAR